MIEFPNITRVTVVNSSGRAIEHWNVTDVKIDLQDDARTLKLFYENESRGSVLTQQPTGNLTNQVPR